ncbi:CaiB/BaiF CoA-transferase family protein [Marinoscillum sp. MHG1-6]|uniref:CaiB/BaiF CoA transferase family protein n=1 Tax=Marinoscillum sp. MHG1-6 TaxID=2959627 RepID=UPI00215781D7|nr:CaiB/BaiF CoA-transferase family protein [Marinoscillum sp. MHG1-6]
MSALPLEGVVVLEFCQYLSGPSAGLRLADLGARVIKIESPKGDACRKLAIENLWMDEDDSLLFHTINRNKESFTANLKDESDITIIKKLIKRAGVVMHNFRPGVMQKLGLGYEDMQSINPAIVYTEISGYGDGGPWVKKPGQDLLLQAKSGLMFTSGNFDDPPVPFGLAIGDILCGAQAVQGILAALVHKEQTGEGALLQLSLLESLLDFQFELLTTYYASGKIPERSKANNGNPLLGAPYGLHRTLDGYIAIAMVNIELLAEVLECDPLKAFTQSDVFDSRDEIKQTLADHLKIRPSEYWLMKLREKDLWAMEVMDWNQLRESEGYQALEMEMALDAQKSFVTTRCPIRMDGKKLISRRAAPLLGADTDRIITEFGLK